MLLPWLRAGHFLGIILWAGGLLALSRLLASHAARATGPEATERLLAVEKAVYRRLASPGAGLVFLTGIAMLHQQPHLLKQPYMHAKFSLIAVLLVVDHLCMRGYKRVQRGVGAPIGRFRLLHGVALACVVGVVLLIQLRPWARL
ncbi:MAG: CopD family protein [Myxococcales bacterium]|nr:CopD family protein [Myxococcales bacterium]